MNKGKVRLKNSLKGVHVAELVCFAGSSLLPRFLRTPVSDPRARLLAFYAASLAPHAINLLLYGLPGRTRGRVSRRGLCCRFCRRGRLLLLFWLFPGAMKLTLVSLAISCVVLLPAMANSTAAAPETALDSVPLPGGICFILPSNTTYTNSLPTPQFGFDDWDAGPDGIARSVTLQLTYPDGSVCPPRVFGSVGCKTSAFSTQFLCERGADSRRRSWAQVPR